jgi:hypothetical protein
MPRYIALNFVEKRLGEKHDRNPMPRGASLSVANGIILLIANGIIMPVLF